MFKKILIANRGEIACRVAEGQPQNGRHGSVSRQRGGQGDEGLGIQAGRHHGVSSGSRR